MGNKSKIIFNSVMIILSLGLVLTLSFNPTQAREGPRERDETEKRRPSILAPRPSEVSPTEEDTSPTYVHPTETPPTKPSPTKPTPAEIPFAKPFTTKPTPAEITKPTPADIVPALEGKIYLTREMRLFNILLDDLRESEDIGLKFFENKFLALAPDLYTDLLHIPAYILYFDVTSNLGVKKILVIDKLGAKVVNWQNLQNKCESKKKCKFNMPILIDETFYSQIGASSVAPGASGVGYACYPQYQNDSSYVSGLKPINDKCCPGYNYEIYSTQEIRVSFEFDNGSQMLILLYEGNNFSCSGDIDVGPNYPEYITGKCSSTYIPDSLVPKNIPTDVGDNEYANSYLIWGGLVNSWEDYYKHLYVWWNGLCNCVSPSSCKGQGTFKYVITEEGERRFDFVWDQEILSGCVPADGKYEYKIEEKKLKLK